MKKVTVNWLCNDSGTFAFHPSEFYLTMDDWKDASEEAKEEFLRDVVYPILGDTLLDNIKMSYTIEGDDDEG